MSSQRHVGPRIVLAGRPFEASVLDLAAAHKGQDRHLVTNDFVGVADGATPLGGIHPPPADPGHFAGRVLEGLRDARAEPLDVALARVIDREGTEPTRYPGLRTGPSCTLAVIRGHGPRVEAAVLGDCEVLVHDGDGVQVVSDARLRRLDRLAVSDLRRRLHSGADVAAARRSILPLLRRHRASMNKPTTYWVVANDRDAARHIRRRWFLAGEARAILVASDGFLRLVDVFRLYPSRTALLTAVLSRGLDDLGRQLRSVERLPGSARTWPRFTDEDDVTAVLLTPADVAAAARPSR